MTRISGVPPDLRSLSRAFGAAAPDLHATASRLAGVSLPEMPPGVSGSVTATLASVGAQLQTAALTVEQAGIDAGHRALWLEIAGRSGLLITLGRLPSSPFPGFELPTITDQEQLDLPELPPEGFTPSPEGSPLEIFTPPPELPRFPDVVPAPGGGGIEIVPPAIPFPSIVHSGDGEGDGEPPKTGGSPLPTPNWVPPTNPPQDPPEEPPPGHTMRVMPPTDQYRDGYWVETYEQGQPVDPSTGKPPSNVTRPEARSRTHVPLPPPADEA